MHVCRLDAALAADTAFLAGLGVMDYSLLLGVDRQNRLLVVGIIDFVRQVRRQANAWPRLQRANLCRFQAGALLSTQRH